MSIWKRLKEFGRFHSATGTFCHLQNAANLQFFVQARKTSKPAPLCTAGASGSSMKDPTYLTGLPVPVHSRCVFAR